MRITLGALMGAVLSAAAALCLSLLMVAPTQAASHPTVESQMQHYLECLSWMYTDPAKHRDECSPGHDFFLPYNNFSSSGLGGDMPAPPEQPACPTDTPAAYVQYTAFIMVGEHHGGDWKPKDPCKPPKDCYDMKSAYQPSGAASLLLVGGCHEHHGCDKDAAWHGSDAPSLLLVGGCHEGCDTAWHGGDLNAPLLMLVGGCHEGCDAAWHGGDLNAPLLMLVGGCHEGCKPVAWHGDDEVPSLLLVGRHGDGGCKPTSWTGSPLEAPELLI